MHACLLLTLLWHASRAALPSEPPEPQDLLIVKGLEYDFSFEASERECTAPIGLEKKAEFDSSFSASSYSQSDRSPSHVRLNSLTGWQPRTSDHSQWLAIDLMKAYKITGIAIQAGNWQDDSSSGTFGNWVTRYKVQFSDSNNPSDYIDYTLNGAVQHFDGNRHRFNTVKQELTIPIVSRYIRISPEAWNREIGLRVELYGCDYPLDMISLTGKEVFWMNVNNEPESSVYFSPNETQISLRFKTDRPNGLLVHGIGSTGDYLGIELNAGVLKININLGTSSRIDGKMTVSMGHSLYDNQWHWFSMNRKGRDMTITLDGNEEYYRIKGSFENLNIDTRLTFGGTDRFDLEGISIEQMFKGCMENLKVNKYLVISEVQRKSAAFSIKEFFYSTCQEPEEVPVTFEDYNSLIYIERSTWSTKESFLEKIASSRNALKPFLVVQFSFRTWEETGLILYNGYEGGYLQIGLYNGLLQVLIYIGNDPTPYRPANIVTCQERNVLTAGKEIVDGISVEIGADARGKGYQGLNDGAWHKTRLEFSENFIVAIIDEETYAVNRLFNKFTPSADYHFGGYNPDGTGEYKPEMQGYIGCLRSLFVNGEELVLQNLLLGNNRLSNGGGRIRLIGKPLVDQCPIVDRCMPNPCFHGGICFQSWFDFVCDCSLTNYDNDKLCFSSRFLQSCEAYHFLNETASGNRYLDVDGSGPIKPMLIDCDIGQTSAAQRAGAPASTYSVVSIMRTDQVNKVASPIPKTVQPGGYTWKVGYRGSDIDALGRVADLSAYCMQYVFARCWSGAKFLNSPSMSPPYAWWVSRQGYRMLHWGNATAFSGKCGCSMTPGQKCVNSQYYCNCDSVTKSGDSVVDDGFLVEKEYLPVREIKAGGTEGRQRTDKSLEFVVGDLYCTGDSRMQNMASFWDKRSALFFPAVDATYAIEVSFYFKTRSDKGVFMVATGSDPGRKYNYPRMRDRDGNNFYLPNSDTDYFKISLVKDGNITSDSIVELAYHNGFRKHMYRFYKPNERRVLNDGMWHYIHVVYTIKDIRVRIDNLFWAPTEPDEELFVTQWDDSYLYDPFLLISERDERLFLNDQIVVGSDSGQVNGFVGCMRALTINGNLLDLHGHAMHEPGFLTFPGCIGQCDRSPCQNNGICFEYWHNFQCDCRESAFAGEICTEEIGYYYDGSDVTMWEIPATLSQKSMSTEVITFGFSTDKPIGTIFQLDGANGNSVRASMSGDGLMIQFEYSGFSSEIIDKNTYTDNKFHSVVIKRDTRITMQVDNYPTVVRDNVGSVAGISNPRYFYVGNNDGGGSSSGFTGCISRVRFNHLVPLKATSGLDKSSGGYAGNCGQLAATIDPFFKPEFYPNWPNDTYTLPYGAIRDRRLHDVNANIGIGVGVVSLAALIIIALVAIKFYTRKGSYRTEEDAGAYKTYDANTAIHYSSGRYPEITTRAEIFI